MLSRNCPEELTEAAVRFLAPEVWVSPDEVVEFERHTQERQLQQLPFTHQDERGQLSWGAEPGRHGRGRQVQGRQGRGW